MNSPRPSPFDIQSHLYAAFLEARTADVALRVRGTWNAVYKLHRVILIQSGFFQSLFTAGFVESSARLNTHRHGPDEIDVIFDDRNITRSAFEICISRLYGGGPPLYISPAITPSPMQPLSPSFYSPSNEEVPKSYHPATPRFLLSLLATSIYLSIPSVASQALTAILTTLGPSTVIQYLNFSLGKPISAASTGEPEAAVGLEHVAIIDQDDIQGHIHSERDLPPSPGMSSDGEKDYFAGPVSQSISSESLKSSSDDSDAVGVVLEPSYHYGALSDKIGEACACWLARWAVDMLAYEDGRSEIVDSTPATAMSRKRSKTIPSDSSSNEPNSGRVFGRDIATIPIVWRRGGLSTKWVAALVSADTLFVKSERERYEFARAVVEMRRKNGILDEEKEWEKMFSEGIYYANMTMDEIITISQDISPSTKRSFVPLAVLQSAQWSHSVLRHQITFRLPLSTFHSTAASQPIPSSPPPREKELGITSTTADILTKISSIDEPDYTNPERCKLYFPIPGDSSIRVGDTGAYSHSDGVAVTMEELFTSYQAPSALAPQTPGRGTVNPRPNNAISNIAMSEANFFGLLPTRHTGSSCIQSDPVGKQRWSPYPPYRFAVEFWDLDHLKEKSRLYSHTVWYAGSLYNVYVQVVRKKGQTQLGVYLHRQSSIDPIPPSSAPASVILEKESTSVLSPERPLHTRGPSLPSIIPSTSPTHYSPSIHPLSRSTTPLTNSNNPIRPSTPASPSTSVQGSPDAILPATATPVTPPQPYRDPRPQVSAYFTISCANAVGSSQMRFTSAPDVFSVSQSWGWKSSSLRTDGYVEILPDVFSPPQSSGSHSKEVSLRATVVLGLV
ncbi:hypothetical protein BDQ12DRAFT_733284 [Crucibulum laeve]|uniref:BTB domain-containing protein n=1 Tax=Crucibulum laeve TaxID=68775 RepID=A0A5C3M8B0_9AGAR|nr:hypothetical protein BDQ12DRAFT_733284 [Crucibulum laeve]